MLNDKVPIAILLIFTVGVVCLALATRPEADSMSLEGVDDAEWVTLNRAGEWSDGAPLFRGLTFEDQRLADELFIESDEAMSRYTSALELSAAMGQKATEAVEALMNLRLCDPESGVCGERSEWRARAEALPGETK